MPVLVDLPPELEQRLRAASQNLDAEAKEALLVSLYRQDKISHRELGRALGLERLETEQLLKRHHVTEDLLTREEYDAALHRLFATEAQ